MQSDIVVPSNSYTPMTAAASYIGYSRLFRGYGKLLHGPSNTLDLNDETAEIEGRWIVGANSRGPIIHTFR